jgi:phosphotriesterase-related protein
MVSGKVQTVLGDINPSSLGITLFHEHLLSLFFAPPVEQDSSNNIKLGNQSNVPQDPKANQPITLENAGWIRRYGSIHPDNFGLQDEAILVDEVRLFKNSGGGTIVDATLPVMGRDPAGLARISKATGVHVLAGCGHYVSDYHPIDMDNKSEEYLINEIIQDVTKGCQNTKIKAGIIGEIGCSSPITKNEQKSLSAASKAQILTGAPLLIHSGRSVNAPFEAMKIVIEAGGDPQRTIISHIDRTLFDQQSMVQLAELGCYLGFDLFGHEISYYRPSPIDMPNDAKRIDHIQGLISNGYLDKLLISHDIGHNIKLTKFGGYGYSHIIENVMPIMKRKGMTQKQIMSIVVDNTARILTMV